MSSNPRDELLAEVYRKQNSSEPSESTGRATWSSRAQYLTQAARRSDEEEFNSIKKPPPDTPTSKSLQTDYEKEREACDDNVLGS